MYLFPCLKLMSCLSFPFLPLLSTFLNFPCPSPKPTAYSLELGLGSLQSGGKEIAEVVGGLVEVVAHPVGTEALGNDVEVEAVKVSLVSIFI